MAVLLKAAVEPRLPALEISGPVYVFLVLPAAGSEAGPDLDSVGALAADPPASSEAFLPDLRDKVHTVQKHNVWSNPFTMQH